MPKVSIIMPVYNGEKYIDKSLGSLINQTLNDIEIICINDCSTDNSLNILQEYASKDSRIKIINSEINQGQSLSKNIAIKQAGGEFLMFLDQDDWYELNACELCYNQAIKNNNDIVMFDFNDYYIETNTFKKNNYRIDGLREQINNPQIKLYELKHDFIRNGYAWCYCYKKDLIIINNILFPSINRFVDDVPFYINAIVNANTISIIDIALYNYRINPNSITLTRPDLWYEHFQARKEGYNYIINSKHAKEFIYPYLIYCIRGITYWFERYDREKTKYQKEYYIRMHNMFNFINNNYNISSIKDYIQYKKFKRIAKEDWTKYQIRCLTKQIFSIKNSYDGKHKVFTILGIKISVKRK